MRKILAFSLVVLAQAALPATLPLVFEANRGQTDSHVQYLARSPRATLWLTGDEAVLGSKEGSLRVRFEGGNRTPRLEAEDALPGKTNYFIGKDSSRWRRDIPLFGKVRYQGIYPGIDAVFYGNPEDFEYDLVLAPGADPRKIHLAYSGAKRMRVDAAGDLIFSLASSEIRQHRPRILQGTKAIDGHYVVLGQNRIGFSIAKYDRKKPLTIDPVVTYSTYLGGSSEDLPGGVAMDAQGNLCIAGATSSPDFPTVGGLHQPPPQNNTLVAYLAKINPAASGAASLVWSTFIGSGSDGTLAFGVALDASGNVFAAGTTVSSDFPTTPNVFQPSANCMNGSNCASTFVVKVAPSGNQLIYASFLGGGVDDAEGGFAVDAAGNAYVVGGTRSPSFPLVGTPFQFVLQGTQNGYLTKIAPDGSKLLYSTFIGGENMDFLNTVAVDSTGIVYVAGNTTSARFPVTTNAYQSSLQGAQSGMVAKFDLTQPANLALVYSSYLGGTTSTASTSVSGVAGDSSGAIYAAGFTSDPTFPVTPGAFQSKFGGVVPNDPIGDYGDAFVLKLTPSAQTQLVYSSFLGGSGNDFANAIAIDGSGRIAIAGTTASSNFPTTADAYECCFSNPSGKAGNGSSGFFALFDPTKSGPSSLAYSMEIAGSTGDQGFINPSGLAMNTAGSVVALVGGIQARSFPVTSSAFQKVNNAPVLNVYIARLDLTAVGPTIASAVNAASFQSTGLSPGLIFTLTGSNLGPTAPFGTQLDDTGKVATLVSGTEVLVNGVAAPLLYGSPTQINAVAPYELAPLTGQTVFVQVLFNGVAGNLMPVTVAATAPGIFVGSGTQGAILNQDNSYNGSTNPAAKGSYVSIYCTGEGQTNPPGIDGHVANEAAAQLARPVAPVSVMIGGVAVPSSAIAYAGAAPGDVAGVLQVTLQIPANAPSGNVPVVLTIGSQSSQTGVTVAIQ
jgi:uncharacterized protein (TIGR03437 family)